MCALFLLSYNSYLQPETDGQCSIDLVHGTEVQLSHFVFEPFLVDGSYLFEKDDAVLCQTALIRLHLYVSWQMSFITLTGNGRRYHSGTVPVANVVLDYKYRPDTALFRTHNGTEIGIINISSFNSHNAYLPDIYKFCIAVSIIARSYGIYTSAIYYMHPGRIWSDLRGKVRKDAEGTFQDAVHKCKCDAVICEWDILVLCGLSAESHFTLIEHTSAAVDDKCGI